MHQRRTKLINRLKIVVWRMGREVIILFSNSDIDIAADSILFIYIALPKSPIETIPSLFSSGLSSDKKYIYWLFFDQYTCLLSCH